MQDPGSHITVLDSTLHSLWPQEAVPCPLCLAMVPVEPVEPASPLFCTLSPDVASQILPLDCVQMTLWARTVVTESRCLVQRVTARGTWVALRWALTSWLWSTGNGVRSHHCWRSALSHRNSHISIGEILQDFSIVCFPSSFCPLISAFLGSCLNSLVFVI